MLLISMWPCNNQNHVNKELEIYKKRVRWKGPVGNGNNWVEKLIRRNGNDKNVAF